jgi:hypothetical protein
MSPMDAAWSVLKADTAQVYAPWSRQTMPLVIQGMVARESDRQGEEALQEALRVGHPGPIFEAPGVKAELMGGRARNPHDFLAPYRAAQGGSGRNFPTAGGPNNEPTIPTSPRRNPLPFDEAQYGANLRPLRPPIPQGYERDEQTGTLRLRPSEP